ncbi:zinc ABC transporter substrate-binding protein [Phormidium tenue FACHB-886]|nr:zinc ABC transporter substrate-binding protein [Phormidium tenue FACHB-886]
MSSNFLKRRFAEQRSVKPYAAKWQLQLAIAALLTGLAGCASTTTAPTPASSAAETADSKPLVVATTPVLCDLTKQIAASTIDLKCLIPTDADPHVYQTSPEDSKAIETAQLVLYAGYNFEPGLIKVIEASSNTAPKVAVDELAVPQPLQGEEGHDHEAAAGEEHDHEGADPHVWHNAQNGIRITEVINENLTKLQPNQAILYADNTEKLTTELAQIDSWIKTQIATIPASSRKLVTTHDALGYYANAYNIPIEGALSGITTDEKPTAARVKELVDEVEASGVPTIFAESTINPNLIETVAKESNVKVSDQELYADTLGAPGSAGDTYQKMLIANTEAIVKGLGGQLTPFQ